MIYIGTSGYSYKHWKQKFYPGNVKQKDWLEYYSQYFETVELNVTFYRLPSSKAFETWFAETPENYIFAVKGSRYITQNKKLNNVEVPLIRFMERVALLQNKLGLILWQFPPNFGLNLERLETFLKLLRKYPYRNAFEFRNQEWFVKEVYDILNKYHFALVIADSPSGTSPEIVTTDYLYIRFHGGKLLYGSEYSEKELKFWAKKILKWAKNKDIYVYFNNDANAFAVKNALSLKSLLKD